MLLNGAHYRMGRYDRTIPFRNRAQIHIAGSTVTYYALQRTSTQLRTRWCDASSFEVDWTPVSHRWGRATFRAHFQDGVRGLEEDAQNFWQYGYPVAPDMDDRPRSHR